MPLILQLTGRGFTRRTDAEAGTCQLPLTPRFQFLWGAMVFSATAQQLTTLQLGYVLPRSAYPDTGRSCRTTARIVS